MRLTLIRTGTLSICILMWLVFCQSALAQSIHPYRTPQAIELTTRLRADSSTSDTKLKLPLLDWIQTMHLRDQITVWLDRRIPNDIELDLSIPKEQSNQQVLELVASHIQSEIAYVDRYVALVPKGTASAIQWAYWSLSSDPSHPSLRIAKKEGIQWSHGRQPQEIWKDFSKQFQLDALAKTTGLMEPPDRWRAGQFESTNAAAIATLLLAGFDQYLIWPSNGPPSIGNLSSDDPKRIGNPGGEFVGYRYTTEIQRIGKDHWQTWKSKWPKVSVTRVPASGPGKPDAWDILAPVDAHRELVEPLAPRTLPKSQPKTNNATSSNQPQGKKYTGRYRGEILNILKSLSKQLNLVLTPVEIPNSLARQEVDVNFKDATLEELLDQLSQASGLKITLEGTSLVIEQADR